MDVMVMIVRAHDALNAMYRMIRPAPDGRRRAKDPGPATRHDEQRRWRGRTRPAASRATVAVPGHRTPFPRQGRSNHEHKAQQPGRPGLQGAATN